MNSGQTMFVILAFVLLASLTLSINRTMLMSSNLGLEMEVNLNALSLGQSLLDEMLNKEFDQVTINGNRIFDANSLSSTLGPEAGESITLPDTYPYQSKSKFKYNDFDDYNNYRRFAKDSILGDFTIDVVVEYVNETNPDNVSGSRTYQKRATVTVTHPNMAKNVQLANEPVIPVVLKDLWVYRRFFQQ
ncbi:MAG: hypothetical protein NTX44_08290 [Ignavibacteriales bacterium]|nr:hypothetical protein [Ignavibacteriales bacterium]